MSKARGKLSPTRTYNACRLGILDGHTQKQIRKELNISKPTLSAHLRKKNTSWKELMGNIKSKSQPLPNNIPLRERGGASCSNVAVMKPPINFPHSRPPNEAPSTGRQPGHKVDTPLKLTEEILETALVRALIDDPIKALNPALAFLDKKKSLSVNDGETEQTEDQKKYYNEVLRNIYN